MLVVITLLHAVTVVVAHQVRHVAIVVAARRALLAEATAAAVPLHRAAMAVVAEAVVAEAAAAVAVADADKDKDSVV